ncbi:hypothetical protein [Serratia plymuthica]|nr:hypothetical protein [Serratia plymuthica]
MHFLSCLYGSARANQTELLWVVFLSCLYGSAPLKISANLLIIEE